MKNIGQGETGRAWKTSSKSGLFTNRKIRFWVRHYDDQQDTFAFRLFRPWTKYPPVDPGYEVDPTLVWPIQFIIPPWALERFLKASVLRRGAAKRDQLRLRELVDSSQVRYSQTES